MTDLEEELMCPICYDIFIEPAVAVCGHMFCHFCITQWATRSNSCPTCRMDMTTVVRIRNGNTIMDLAAELTSQETRDRRAAALRQRNIDQKNLEHARRQRRQAIHVQPPPPPQNWFYLPDVRSNDQFDTGAYYHHHSNPSRMANNRSRVHNNFFGRYSHNLGHQRYNRWRRF